MQAPKKLLIVGEPGTGKSAIIRAFLQHQQMTQKDKLQAEPYQNSNCMASTNADGDTQNNYSNSDNMLFNSSSNNIAAETNANQQTNQQDTKFIGQSQANSSQMASSQVSNMDPSTRQTDVSQNTYKRHTIQQKQFMSKMGENTDFSLKILKIEGQKVRVQLWDQGNNINPKTTFQPLYTRHVSGCIVVANTSNPLSITKAAKWKEQFDKITKVKDEPSIPCTLVINHDVSVPSFDVLRGSDSDQLQKSPKLRKESESFQEQSLLASSSIIEQNRHIMTPTRQSIHDTCSLKKQDSQFERGTGFTFQNTPVNHNKQLDFEKLAKNETNCFFGIYHVSTTQQPSIYDSFENFIQRVLEDEDYAHRTFSVASNFFDQYTLKNIKSQTLNSDTNMDDDHINWSDDQQVYEYYQKQNQKNENKRDNDMQRTQSQEFSFKLRTLKDRRYSRLSQEGNNSCC